MPRALLIGGTGLIGRATARRLAAAGWQVDVTGRDSSRMPSDLSAVGVGFVVADRDDEGSLITALQPNTDLLVDNIGYTAAQARLLMPLLPQVGSAVFMSSKAVYIDDAGRHSNSPGGPQFSGPVDESQPTMVPREDIPYDDAVGYGANKVAAEQVLLDSGHPVTVLRPSKVHGEAAKPPREWLFAKRVLDRRPWVLLAHRGAGVDHPSAAANIAALVETAAAHPGRRILNAADPDAPTALEISRAAARHLGHDWREVLFDDAGAPGLGATPWDRTSPVVLDMTAAAALGYQPVGDYATTVTSELDWLTTIAEHTANGWEIPAEFDDGFFDGRFDYASEDRYLATAGGDLSIDGA
jgi:nucleoside-diphosphate-sugar epimerase